MSHVDVAPTLLELARTEASRPLHGRSLLEPAPTDASRAVLRSAVGLVRTAGGETKDDREPWYAVRDGDLRLVERPARGERWLFDLARDPGERQDLAGERGDLVETLASKLERWREEMALVGRWVQSDGAVELDAQELERLRSLGYVGGRP